MSTAVLDEPRVEAEYVMPPVTIGQMVVLYQGGNIDSKHGELAIVQKMSPDHKPQQLVVSAISRGGEPSEGLIRVDHVRHVTDPRLKSEWVRREGGAWDYTPWEKDLRGALNAKQDQIDELRLTVQKLVADLGGSSTKGKKAE